VGARLVRGGSPTYPPFAKQLKVSGTVRLEVRIAPDGKVSGVRTIAGHPVLAGAAMDAARRWVYAPATLDGAPIASTTQVDISFTSK
jgi:protein TonB